MRATSQLISFVILGAACCRAQSAIPRFEDYSIAELFSGNPAAPVLATSEQRQFRSRIRNGVTTGSGVWTGSWKNPVKGSGPNFAGHYFVIRWGCGSQCVMMAIADANTGTIYDPPLSGVGSELYVPLDNLSEMEIDFRPDSSLMVLRNACRDFKKRDSCGVYYFNWRENRFSLLRFIRVNPLGSLR